MKKALKNIQGTILLFMIAMAAIVTIVLFASQVEFRASLFEFIKKVIWYLRANSDRVLLYVGAITLAIHYLRQRRWVRSTIIFFIGLLWIGYYGSTIGFVSNLGADSFHEAGAFDTSEALFWFSTFAEQLQFSLSLKVFVLFSGVSLGFYAALVYASLGYRPLRTHFRVFQPFVASMFIATALYQSVGGAVEMFYENSNSFERVAEKFDGPIPSATTSKNINVLLYIGESTSVMNMALYGYSRNSTPLLSRLEQTDESLLKFENVFATHTHTSPSLLEALSIGLYRNDDTLPITDRRRTSIVDIVSAAGVGTELYSNQGQTGTWNFASSIVFKNAGKKVFSTDSRRLGNSDYMIEKPWDDEFFGAQLKTEDLDTKSSTLVVFHSYAGHGNYASNIPPSFRDPVDEKYSTLNRKAVTGQINSLHLIEEYDSAIKYIDFAVFSAIETVQNSRQPWIFLYFADHGDAVFPARGHDSSRFIHDMARIPFVIYFNAAARTAYPDLFNKYTRLSKTKNIGTLAQLPSIIFDLLGVVLDPATEMLPVIGAPTTPLPIVIRQTLDGVTAVNLSSEPLPTSLSDATDSATRHFVAANRAAENTRAICYHRSNSIAKALRGSLVTNCLEIDIMVDKGGAILAYHPPAENTDLSLRDIFSAVRSNQKLAFWLDGKNLNSRETCNGIQLFLANEIPAESMGVVVEFPTGSHKVANEIADCLGTLIKMDKVHTSYYVPTGPAVGCSKQLAAGKAFETVDSCVALQADLLAVKDTGLFTDISFDYAGVRAIEELDFLTNFSWNTWHVKAADLFQITPTRFRMIILTNDDPNNI